MEHQPPQPILLAGVSIRMLAELAVQAGYQVTALDYFGDVDLEAICPARSLRRDYGSTYSAEALANASEDIPAPSVAYGASLENHPAAVTRLIRDRQLFGNAPEVLERVRDPDQIAAVLGKKGFLFPQTVAAPSLPDPGSRRQWLWKPLKSGGGHSIHIWHRGTPSEGGLFQEQIPGMACSAAFVADGLRARVFGITEQLVGRPEFGASGFRYCGNLVPPRLKPKIRKILQEKVQLLADHLTQSFRLKGLNGLDFVLLGNQVWTVEINPRPSASLELFSEAYNVPVFKAHIESFYGRLPEFDFLQHQTDALAAGKAILYAGHDVIVGDTSDWRAQGLRDIPHPGEQIRRHHPLCTILTFGSSPTVCLRQLRAKARQIEQKLIRA
jgi:predicted ATP-grasp superfamily ATP-dependent carboligase